MAEKKTVTSKGAKKPAVKKKPTAKKPLVKKQAAKKTSAAKGKKSAASAKKSGSSSDFYVYELPEVSDITIVSRLLTDFQDIINKNSNKIAVDGSKVVRITTPCVQLLISVGKTAAEENIEYYVQSPSDAMKEVFRDLGLEGELNKWSMDNE